MSFSKQKMTTKTVEAQKSEEEEKIAIEFAGFRRRMAAFVIDLIILGWITGIISRFEGTSLWQDVALLAVSIVIPVGYFVWPYSTSGQTLGKEIIGIKVVAIDGSSLNWRRGFLRYLGYIPSTIAFLLGFLWLIWDVDEQAWHDKIAGTCVVRAGVTSYKLLSPIKASRRQRKWLAMIGIPILVLLIINSAVVWTSFQHQMAEIDTMAPWPHVSTAPCQIVNPNLSSLDLLLMDIVNASDEEMWKGANFSEGSVAKYHHEGEIAAIISVLKYPDPETLEEDYYAITEKYEITIGDPPDPEMPSGSYFSSHDYGANKGVFSFNSANVSNKMFWNDRWLVDIIVSADVNVDQVRDELVNYWHSKYIDEVK